MYIHTQQQRYWFEKGDPEVRKDLWLGWGGGGGEPLEKANGGGTQT